MQLKKEEKRVIERHNDGRIQPRGHTDRKYVPALSMSDVMLLYNDATRTCELALLDA